MFFLFFWGCWFVGLLGCWIATKEPRQHSNTATRQRNHPSQHGPAECAKRLNPPPLWPASLRPCTKFVREGSTLPYPPADPVHCAGPHSLRDHLRQHGCIHTHFLVVFFRPKFEFKFGSPEKPPFPAVLVILGSPRARFWLK